MIADSPSAAKAIARARLVDAQATALRLQYCVSCHRARARGRRLTTRQVYRSAAVRSHRLPGTSITANRKLTRLATVKQTVMFHLVYISSATELFTKSALIDLMEQAREKNARLGITGILLYRDGNILQTLEGEQSAVEDLFQTIARDPRHADVLVLLRGEIAAREFPDWSMAFRDLSIESEATLPGFSPFLNTPLTAEHFATSPGKVQTLLNLFKQNMR